MKLVEDINLVVFHRRPHSKKKRILKKWKKDLRNFKPDTNVYMVGELACCHPAMATEVRRVIREEIASLNTVANMNGPSIITNSEWI